MTLEALHHLIWTLPPAERYMLLAMYAGGRPLSYEDGEIDGESEDDVDWDWDWTSEEDDGL